MIRDGPAVIDVHLDHALLDAARTRHVADLGDNGNGYFQFIAADNGGRFRILSAQPIALDRPLPARSQFLVARPFVHDRRIRVGDPGDVVGFEHD